MPEIVIEDNYLDGDILFPMPTDRTQWFLEPVVGCAYDCKYCDAKFYASKYMNGYNALAWPIPILRFNDPYSVLEEQLINKTKEKDVIFVCKTTDPFMNLVNLDEMYIKLINIIHNCNRYCRVLTKGLYPKANIYNKESIYGITITSLKSNLFYEPYVTNPMYRINRLYEIHANGYKTWVSITPYMPLHLKVGDINNLLNEIVFVDEIVFGGLNYFGKLTNEDKLYYLETTNKIMEFCKNNEIVYYNEGIIKNIVADQEL